LQKVLIEVEHKILGTATQINFSNVTVFLREGNRKVRPQNKRCSFHVFHNKYTKSRFDSWAKYVGPHPVFEIIIQIQEKPLLTHLSEMFETLHLADVLFIVKGQEMKAHSAIVAAASSVMATMLDPHKFQEGRSKTVEMIDIEPDVFRGMLRYLYTGVAPDMNKSVDQWFLVADKYEISSLKEACSKHWIRQLDVDNVISILLLAHQYQVPELLEAALDLVAEKQKIIWQLPDWTQVVEKDPRVFYLATRRMCARICEDQVEESS
jgi:BTB/POZ domain